MRQEMKDRHTTHHTLKMIRSSKRLLLERCNRTLIRQTLRSFPSRAVSSRSAEPSNSQLWALGNHDIIGEQRRYLRTSVPANRILEFVTNRQEIADFSTALPHQLTSAAEHVHSEYDRQFSQLLDKLKDEQYHSDLLETLTSIEGPPTTILNIADLMCTMFTDEPLWNQAAQHAASHQHSPQDMATLLSALQVFDMHVQDGSDLSKLVKYRIQAYTKQGLHVPDRYTWDFLTTSEQYLSVLFATAVLHGRNRDLWSTHEQLERIDAFRVLKQKQSELLGFESHIDQAFRGRMLSRDSIEALLVEVSERALTFKTNAAEANSEYTVLPLEKILPIVRSAYQYFSSNVRPSPTKGIFDVGLSNYISMNGALGGLIALSQTLFGITISEEQKPRGWHSDVRLFHVADENAVKLGSIYFDPYRRDRKMQGSFSRPITSDVMYISTDTKRSMWEDLKAPVELEDLEALAYEFGHALQYLLADADKREGLWKNDATVDVVEIFPRFMEHWVCQDFFLQSVAFKSAKVNIPDKELRRVLEERRLRKIDECLQKAFLGLIEFEMFDHRNGDEPLADLERRVAERFTPHTVFPETKISPLVQLADASGRTAVAQYRVLMSEVLSADIIQSLHQANITNEEEMRSFGERIKEVLLKPGVLVDGKRALRELCGRETVSTEGYFNMYKL